MDDAPVQQLLDSATDTIFPLAMQVVDSKTRDLILTTTLKHVNSETRKATSESAMPNDEAKDAALKLATMGMQLVDCEARKGILHFLMQRIDPEAELSKDLYQQYQQKQIQDLVSQVSALEASVKRLDGLDFKPWSPEPEAPQELEDFNENFKKTPQQDQQQQLRDLIDQVSSIETNIKNCDSYMDRKDKNADRQAEPMFFRVIDFFLDVLTALIVTGLITGSISGFVQAIWHLSIQINRSTAFEGRSLDSGISTQFTLHENFAVVAWEGWWRLMYMYFTHLAIFLLMGGRTYSGWSIVQLYQYGCRISDSDHNMSVIANLTS
jgi:hypothetical protein